MGVINVRLAVGALLGGALLIGAGTAVVSQHHATVQSEASQAAPAATVPGYTGPVYNSEGKLVGYAQPDGTTTSESAPAEDPRGRDMSSAPGPAANAPVVETAAPVVRSAPAPVHRGRSTRKSVAIVAGSAGAGAAIGALAGGGKGAGIGAISGGAAGLVYDRMTHNK